MASEKGQMFIELIVGIAIITVTLVGVVFLSTISSKTSRVAGDRNFATTLAEKEQEIIRRERDENQVEFFNHANGAQVVIGCVGTVPSPYTCTATYNYIGTKPSNQVKVTVTITWPEGNGTDQVQLVTYLANNR